MKKTITVQIEKIVAGGLGLARLSDGMVTLVPYVLPDETVAINIVKRHKGYAEACLKEVLEPSPQRIAPPCPHFRECGGCRLQHMPYAYQVEIKETILAEDLQRNLAVGLAGDVLADFSACSEPFNYRQRIRLQVDEFGSLGFYAVRSHNVVEVESCSLAMPALNEALFLLNNNLHALKILQHTSEVELWFNPALQQVVVIFSLSRKPRAADRKSAELLVNHELLQSIWLRAEGSVLEGPFVHGDVEGNEEIGFSLSGGAKQLDMRFETGGFCQVNLAQNDKLIATLLAWADLSGHERVLDLYCGMGNFSLPLALRAREVVGTDVQRSSIRSAKRNALRNEISNVRFLRSDGLQALRSFAGNEKFDILVLDPPRRGCKDIIATLAELDVSKIIYVSCDSATLIRDIKLLQNAGFKLVKIKGFDMFPQTHHLETMALLQFGA